MNWWKFDGGGELVARQSFGPYVRFKGGAGGGQVSGGGQSGRIDFPAYMKTWHGELLDDATADALDMSVTDALNAAWANSPFAAAVAYDPDSALDNMDAAVAAFDIVVDALDYDGDWEAAVDTAVAKVDADIVTDTYIDEETDAYEDILDDTIISKVLPEFRTGMRDINAGMSSAYAIGEAHIWAMRDRDVAKFTADLQIKLATQRDELVMKGVESILKNLVLRVEYEKSVAHITSEVNRIRIVAKKEEADQNLSIDENDAKWDLELFAYGSNVLASISGAAVSAASGEGMQPSTTSSVLGGVLSGAGSGAMIGSMFGMPWLGAGIGALLGGLGGGGLFG